MQTKILIDFFSILLMQKSGYFTTAPVDIYILDNFYPILKRNILKDFWSDSPFIIIIASISIKKKTHFLTNFFQLFKHNYL